MGQFVGRSIITDSLVFQADASNGLCDNVTNVKNIVNPTEIGTFVNGASVINNEYAFDGVNDYIDSNFSIYDYSITSSFTVEYWIQYNSLINRQICIGKYDGGNHRLYLGNDDETNFVIGVANIVNTTINHDMVQDNWYSVSFTFDGVTLTTYVNAVNKGTLTPTFGTLVGVGNDVYIGAMNNLGSSQNFVDGQMSNVKMYDKALTQAEITQNYEAQKHKYL